MAVTRPVATIASRTSVPTTARSVVREAGTASAFQMPPSPAREPSVPRPGSARAENAARPGTSEVTNAPLRAEAISHGSAADTATAITVAAQRTRLMPLPGTAIHTSATVAASISPVGVRPASAIQNMTDAQAAQGALLGPAGLVRNRINASATQGRQPYPTSRLQCPCNRRSPTYGFQMASVTAMSWPGNPTAGSSSTASRAAPQPARKSPAMRRALTTIPPSTAKDSTATAKSWGRARGAAWVSPKAASDR